MTERYHPLYSPTEVDQAVARMASEITAKYDEKDPLFVNLRRGGGPLSGKLMSEISRQAPDFHPEIDDITVVRYGNNGALDDQPVITQYLSRETEVEGRGVIMIDSVLDMGVTSEFVRRHLLALGAGFVELAVMVDKDVDRLVDIEADYYGFRTENQWLAGMGMKDLVIAGSPEAPRRYKEGYRWRNSIWTITPDTSSDRAPLVTPLINA